MLIIVNADDLGGSEIINEAIYQLMADGLVTSGTIMANGPGLQHAARNAGRFPQCSFGVHLNLSDFRPLRPCDAFKPWLTPEGTFSKSVFRATITGALAEAVEQEFSAQIQTVIDAGVTISHLDSHEHIHVLPQVFPIFRRVQRRFVIPRVRSTINLLPHGERMPLPRRIKKELFRFALRHVYRVKSPDGLGSFRDFHRALTNGLPRFDTLELMVHPGTRGPEFIAETNLLRSGWQALLPQGTKLGSYYEL